MAMPNARRRCGSSRPMWRQIMTAIAPTKAMRPSFSSAGIENANASCAVTASTTAPAISQVSAMYRCAQNAKRRWNSMEPMAQPAHQTIRPAGAAR